MQKIGQVVYSAAGAATDPSPEGGSGGQQGPTEGGTVDGEFREV